MRKLCSQLIGAYLTLLLATSAVAQSPVTIQPVAPNSSDTIIVKIPFPTVPGFVGDSYRVEMVANRIRVILGANERGLNTIPFTLYADVGKLPAGTYAVDAFDTDKTTGSLVLLASSASFTVTDARIGKAAPFVVFNVADHWWNAAESGWGLFIWHDRLDRLLAAWFTYGPDNKPVWYTIQDGAWTSPYVYDGKIYQTNGPVFSAFAPGSSVSAQVVGTARLNFGPDSGMFTYTLSGVTQTKNIVRFKP